MHRVDILNISIDNLTQYELLERLRGGGMVVTPNVDHLVRLQNDPEFHRIYRHAEYVVCDSQILWYASRLLGTPLQAKISGSDLFPAFYEYFKTDPEIRIFLLGGPPGTAAAAQTRINDKVGRAIIVGALSPSYGFEQDAAECAAIVDEINASQATVLGIGVGSPKQEKWVDKHRQALKTVRTFLAIGATINFEAGHQLRAPRWMSEHGLEWLFRLALEPKRLWRRYLVESLPFFSLIAQQKLSLYSYRLPLGQILQDAGLLTAEQLEWALHEQSCSQLRLGDLIARRGWLKQQTLNFFAEDFPQLTTHQLLGQSLKAAALLDETQVRAVLAAQQHLTQPQRFGEIAVKYGWVKPETIDILMKQMTWGYGVVKPRSLRSHPQN